ITLATESDDAAGLEEALGSVRVTGVAGTPPGGALFPRPQLSPDGLTDGPGHLHWHRVTQLAHLRTAGSVEGPIVVEGHQPGHLSNGQVAVTSAPVDDGQLAAGDTVNP